ncbi:tape measure protein [uncultured Psychrobacter sp.]|uniref:tape measure protein n=1 Tax=uncultured Psychrobacter sp. TaxID=259303 RepID=UPI002596CA3D|nr:tape measure protein [uncultured Psychrobacter sp.]
MANQESRLAIVIDSSKAESNLKSLRQSLAGLSTDSSKAVDALGKFSGGSNSFSSLITATESLSKAMQRATMNSRAFSDALRSAFSNIAPSTGAAESSLSRFDNSIKRLVTGLNRLEIQMRGLQTGLSTFAGQLNPLIAGINRLGTSAGGTVNHFNNMNRTFNNTTNNTNNLNRSITNTSNITNNLNRTINNTTNNYNRLGDVINQNTTIINNYNNAASNTGGILGGLVGKLRALGGAFGLMSIIQTADSMQTLDSQVRLVTNSVEEFNAVQARLREISNSQYADIESLTQLYTRSQRALSQLGKSQNEVLQFTENVSMAMRVGGVSAQEQAAALLQLSQALGSGRLAGDEFASIAEQAPILLSLVSKELGVTQGELKKLASDGKITSEVVFRALSGATEELTEMASQMPVTIGQALTVLSSNYKTFVGDFLNRTTGWTGVLASAVGFVAQKFDSIGTILLGGAALWGVYTLAVSGVIPAVAALTAVMLANPVFMLAAVLTASVIATEGLEGAIDSLADAFAVLGLLALEAIGWIKSGISDLWKATNDYIGGLIENSATGAEESSGAFSWMFERTEGGFVGMLQVAANVFDKISVVALATALTIDKGIQNAGIAVQRVAAGMGNALVGAFNWAAQKVTEILNSIGAEINDKIEALNQLPLVNITYRAKTDRRAMQAQGYQSPDYIPNTFAGNYQHASNYVDLNGLRGKVDDAIYRREYAQLREENSRSTDSLNEVGNAAAKMADELDKAGKKGKEGTKNIAKGAKEAKEEMSEAKKAAMALNKSYLNAQQSLQRTFNLIGHDTNLAQWVYDLGDPMHDLFNLAEDSKDVLKGFAASIDISEFSYDLGKSNKDLEHQIKLLDAKSDLERELMDIEKETADLIQKYEIFKNIPGFAHVYKDVEAEAKLNEQWKKNLATKEATVAISKELTQSTGDLNKQIALLGNDSPLNSFLYDLQNTEKYANAGAEALEKYEQALRSLEKAELAQKMREDMGGLRTELLGYKSNTDDRDKSNYELEDTLTRIRQARELGLNIGGQYDQLEQIAKQRHADKMAEIDNAMYQNRAGLFASASKALLGENSRTYKLMFAIEKGYALQSAWLKSKKAVLDAYAETPGSVWNKALAAAKAAADTGLMAAAIAAVQAPIGQAHDGIMSVPKSGTWNLEKGERVLPAHTAKAMDKKLEQGGKVIIHNYSGEKAEAKQDMDGNTIVVIGKMVNGIVDQKLAKFKRQEQRQGGLFSG